MVSISTPAPSSQAEDSIVSIEQTQSDEPKDAIDDNNNDLVVLQDPKEDDQGENIEEGWNEVPSEGEEDYELPPEDEESVVV